VIEMVVEILSRAGLKDFKVLLNSVGDHNCRPAFVAKLREELAGVVDQLCGDCQRRAVTNPLRVLDCKVEADQPIIEKLPSILDSLCEDCKRHFEAVKRYLTDRGIEYEVKARMVRGLDYYMRTTFEVVHGALGAQNSVLGGGRYDGLAEVLGSKVKAPGIGFSIGEDRLVMAVEESAIPPKLDFFIAVLGEVAMSHVGSLVRDLRSAGFSVQLAEGKLKRIIEVANKLGARYALIIGDNEIAAGKYALKNMETGVQDSVSAPEIFERVKPWGQPWGPAWGSPYG
jgi:histidyl-tRNA synthetase